MEKVLVLMMALAAPTPVPPQVAPRAASQRPVRVLAPHDRRPRPDTYEQSPVWGKDPVSGRPARFNSVAHFGIESQLAAQKFGADRHRQYMDMAARWKVPVGGNFGMGVVQQYQISRGFNTTVGGK